MASKGCGLRKTTFFLDMADQLYCARMGLLRVYKESRTYQGWETVESDRQVAVIIHDLEKAISAIVHARSIAKKMADG